MPQNAPNEDITITLSDNNGRINADMLAAKLRSALDLLESIHANVVTAEDVVRWNIVRVTMRSPLTMTFRPEIKRKNREQPRKQRQVIKECLTTIDWMESGKTDNLHVSLATLNAAKALAQTTDKDGSAISFGTTKVKRKVTLTSKTVSTVNQMISKSRRYVDVGTIEGMLEVISARDGKKKFELAERLTRHRIECTGPDEMFSDAIGLWNQRVAVTGRIRYSNHVPQSIEVTEPIRRLKTIQEVTPLKDMPPIDITGGMSSEEYVRSIRQCLK